MQLLFLLCRFGDIPSLIEKGFMKLHIWFLAIIIIFFGCKDDSKNNYAYFGGQIINPKNNFVVFFKNEKVLDTVALDGYNRFIYKIDSLQEGMYTFKHGDEFQMVLLEPNDSIMLRLNTLDFDESLVFTGVGAKKNNYFTNEFLQNEIEEKKVFKFCQLDPKTYETRIESIRIKKEKQLEDFKSKYPTSHNFNRIAKANIDYNYYFNKEIYPFVHYGKNKEKILASLPSGFYDYRKKINYNDEMLKDYFTYKSFLRTHISNLSLEKHLNHSDKNYVEDYSCYTIDKLAIIDSLISNKSIKNDILYHYTVNALTKCDSHESLDDVLASYMAKSDDEEMKMMVKKYAASINRLKPGNSLPDINIMDFSGNKKSISNITNNTKIIYFWSHTNYNHFRESHNKIKELKIKYPEVDFISINIDDYPLETTKKTLLKNYFPLEMEYRFENPMIAKETLAIYPINKTLILDQKGKIIESKANIFNMNFEEVLLGALNQ